MAAIATVRYDSANLMCCHQGPSKSRAPWWFCDANRRSAKWFSSPAASASICCWAEAQPAACLSQHGIKLAGEEALSCANYILIIGNVLANQALIAISEPVSSSRAEGLSALAGPCWAQFSHRRWNMVPAGPPLRLLWHIIKKPQGLFQIITVWALLILTSLGIPATWYF